MVTNPILPVWLMGIICVALLLLKRKGIWSFIRQIIFVALLFMINLRIMILDEEVPDIALNVDVLFVIDNTMSMLAEDYGTNEGRRIDAVKDDCEYIIEEFDGASFSVISFGNEVHEMIPYTTDTEIVREAILSLSGQTQLYAQGTGFNDVLAFTEGALENDRETFQVVFFISDGEITSGEELFRHSRLKRKIDAGAVLGYGTEQGGPMMAPWYAGDGAPSYVYSYNDAYRDDDYNALSRIDEGNLEEIAGDMGVPYIHMTRQSAMEDTIESIMAEIMATAEMEYEDDTIGRTETYYYFLIPLLALMVFDYIYYNRRFAKKKKKKGKPVN